MGGRLGSAEGRETQGKREELEGRRPKREVVNAVVYKLYGRGRCPEVNVQPEVWLL